MRPLWFGALYGQVCAENYRVFDNEESAEAWQEQNPTGVIWRAVVDVEAGDAAA